MSAQPAQTSDAVAAAIYQEHLDEVSDDLFAGRTAACMERFCLPLLIRTATTETLFETYADLYQDTEQHTASLQGYGVTHYIRLVKSARYLGADLIEGWHETHILRNANAVMPNYRSRMVLRLEDDVWKVAEAEHELANHRFPIAAVKAATGTFDRRWTAPLSDIRTIHMNAKPVYQAYLDVLSRTQNARDFEAWAGLYSFPYSAHYEDQDRVFTQPEETRDFFDRSAAELDAKDAVLVRTATQADFIASDRIVGYHETHMIKDGTVVFGPVKSRMFLTLTEGRWLCSSVTNSLRKEDGSPFELSDDIPTMREIEERMRK